MNSNQLVATSLLLAAGGLAALSAPLVQQWWRRRQQARMLDLALERQSEAARARSAASRVARPPSPAAHAAPHASMAPATAAAAAAPSQPARQSGPAAKPAPARSSVAGADPHRTARWQERWLKGALGTALAGPEEARLLEQCGWYGVPARLRFAAVRLILPPLIGTVWWACWQPAGWLLGAFVWFAGFAATFLGVKAVLARRARSRLRDMEDELPVLVDMLRLLQGVGMSIDQSLQLIVAEFRTMLPVLGPELQRANAQFASGRSREQTLRRIGQLFDSDELRNLITLLAQVDRFGGAVQEPLRLFGIRLQEARKLRLKERVGQLTVKMTGVMVVSLLPVLLIVTAGPGFLGVIRMLTQIVGAGQ